MEKQKRIEAGRKGGLSTSQKHGISHFAEIGRTGGAETRNSHDPSYYRDIGKTGGRPLAQPPEEYKDRPFARGRDIGKIQRDTSLYILLPCAGCGKERWVRFIKGKPETTVCRHCVGYNSRWKGGRVQFPNGYIQIKLYPDNYYFPMAKSGGYVFEHRLVMAQSLGRLLQPWEAVHHKNGNKSDNRIENLELTTTKNHISDHNKGYSDGLAKGFRDGRSQRIHQLEAEVTTLKAELSSLRNNTIQKV